MYLLDVALHHLACLAKKGNVVNPRTIPFVSLWEALSLQLQLACSFTETVQLLACDFIEIVF